MKISRCRNSCCCLKVKACCQRIFQSLRSVHTVRTFRNILYLYALTFLIVLPLLCMKLPNSVYYKNREGKDAAIDRLKRENTKRLRNAELLLAGQSFVKTLLTHYSEHVPESVHVAVSLITVSRRREDKDSYDPRYLTQSLAGVLSQVLPPLAPNFRLSVGICNVDQEPNKYKEALDLASTFNLTHFVKYERHGADPVLNIYEKEKQDYVYCIRQSVREFGADYHLMLEDDALLHDDAFQVLDDILNHRLPEKMRNALYVKLFHPDRVLGYISLEVERIPELISVGCVFGLILAFAYKYLNPFPERYFYRVWFTLALYVSLVALCVGRQNLTSLRRLSPQLYTVTRAPSCCTPAMLFPTRGAEAYTAMLDQVQCKKGSAKDIAPLGLIKHSKLRPYFVHPNLIHHIGMYSSLRKSWVV